VPEPIAFHLELPVGDLGRSVRFYRQLLECPPLAHAPGQYALFDVWGLQLLLRVAEVSRPVRFGFRLGGAAQLRALEGRWQAEGLGFERREWFHPALCATEFAANLHDPDGHRCSFYVLVPV
jgi:catechol 2,3-dioxygenase-like lactoylglutathione lyase family enzyme